MAESMETDSKDGLSERLSTVMEDFGVTEELVNFRRYVANVVTIVLTILERKNLDFPRLFHIVGSHCEGSTTLGLNSDIDILTYDTSHRVYLDLSECQTSLHSYVLVIQNSFSFPQCVCLQYVMRYPDNTVLANVSKSILLIPRQCCPPYILDEEGRVLLSSDFVVNNEYQALREHLVSSCVIEQHGPAINHHNDIDIVPAVYSSTIPLDCQALFERPKPGNWPKEETASKAKQCGVFFINPGYIGHISFYDSSSRMINMDIRHPTIYAFRQWRMSTTAIERLLMLDLDIVQMKTYILTKLIRKQFLEILVGDRLSTFHMKTALLFTIEKYPPIIWKNGTIVQCVLYCLKTLRRFLKRRFCPHYTIASVDLFSLKLRVGDFLPLIMELTKIINSDLKCVYEMNIDNLGERMKVGATKHDSELVSRSCYRIKTLASLISSLTTNRYSFVGSSQRARKLEDDEMIQMVHNFKEAIEEESDYNFELTLIYQNICNSIASLLSSAKIDRKEPITDDIYELYQISIKSGQITNYLKYASMLVSTHRYEEAVELLETIESLILSKTIIQFSYQTRHCDASVVPVETNMKQLFSNWVETILMPVEFSRLEINCIPRHMVYEFNSPISEEDSSEQASRRLLMLGFVHIDAIPFLYYLQYLSYRDNTEKQEKALSMFSCFFSSTLHHQNTDYMKIVINIFGHICEINKMTQDAWNWYKLSVQLYPRNNAAYWHMCRLLWQYVSAETESSSY